MALNLITQEEASRLLGVTADELSALREAGQIHGYRDGSIWKFKRQDVEQLVETRRNAPAESDSDDFIDLSFGESDDDADAVLLSERELGDVGPSTSSTVIGKPGDYNPAESDIRLVTEVDRTTGGSDVRLAPADDGTPGSDVKVVASGDSSVIPLGEEAPSGEGGSTFEFRGTGSDLGLGEEALSDVPLDLGSDVSLGEDSIDLDDDSLFGEAEGGSSSLGVQAPASDSVIDLDLGGSDLGLRPGGRSDVTRNAADSGISLASPADSGISLELPIELASADEPFELGEDPMLSLSADSDSAEVGSVSLDEEFMLTPLEESADASSEDSGSQVIALDSQADFADSPGALLELDGDTASPSMDFGGVDLGSGAPLASEGAAMAAPLASREAPYSLLNVISLGGCLLLLGMSGMMVYDLLRNMWSWNGPTPVTSPLMELLANLF